MASAKRVPQAALVTGKRELEKRQEFQVFVTNGVETAWKLTHAKVASVDNRKFTPQPDRIVLDISIEEAETLRSVLGLVGGMPTGRRGLTEAIYAVLGDAGVRYLAASKTGATGTIVYPASIQPSPNQGTQSSPTEGGEGPVAKNAVEDPNVYKSVIGPISGRDQERMTQAKALEALRYQREMDDRGDL